MRKQRYWFKVTYGKWDENGDFDPEVSSVFIEAWEARHAIIKAQNKFEIEEDEIPTGVEYLGYPQMEDSDDSEDEENVI